MYEDGIVCNGVMSIPSFKQINILIEELSEAFDEDGRTETDRLRKWTSFYQHRSVGVVPFFTVVTPCVI
jgi:hypothetical protein